MSANRDLPGGEKRRVHRRQPRAGATVVYWWNLPASGPGHTAEIHDISEDGLRLIVRRTLERGASIQLGRQPPDGGAPVLRLAVVAWCAARDSACMAGVRFAASLSEGELARLA